MFIAGHPMKLQVWTPTFKPAEETPIVPIWVTLPELPWHCYYMDILTPLLSPIGKALYLGSATMQKTRGSAAKVRVQIDITKDRPHHVWMGFSEKDPTLGKWQIIEFEDVPSYCLYCKHQGHIMGECPVKGRDEETKRKKELEANKKGQEKLKNQTPKDNVQQQQGKEKIYSDRQTKGKGPTEEDAILKEEQWQIQTRRKNKNQQQNQEQGKKHDSQMQLQKKQTEESGDQIPIPPSPIIVDADKHLRRMDVQEETTNLQEGEPKGRELSHVMHENQMADHRHDLQAPPTTNNAGHHQQEHVLQVREKTNQQSNTNREGQKQLQGSMAK
ncbi:hypothetical protein R3W88_007976 [Solanum pinnatisectum]|uniref:DUF4283 domain-containing protein n=1 Tax=Solanum pinnatisectum TaxID=50273 RepID=A0AAV9MA26_9SOLN|nr:hypothetical protein R3W88_007976 [Solanum pinnatisectum]